MIDPTSVAAAYLELWNEGDKPSRDTLIEAGWAADARYADPVMAGDGRDGISDVISKVRAEFHDHSFALRGAADGHGPFVRFSWTLISPAGANVATGTDIVRLDGDGYITEVIGFLDGGAA